jgi:hypothetical protein
MMWFTKIAAQVVNDSITKVQVRIQGLEGNGCDLVFYSAGPLLFQILDVTRIVYFNLYCHIGVKLME